VSSGTIRVRKEPEAGRDRPAPAPSGHVLRGSGAGRSSKRVFVASVSTELDEVSAERFVQPRSRLVGRRADRAAHGGSPFRREDPGGCWGRGIRPAV
jgi:hypothetical protein